MTISTPFSTTLICSLLFPPPYTHRLKEKRKLASYGVILSEPCIAACYLVARRCAILGTKYTGIGTDIVIQPEPQFDRGNIANRII